jgi:hypothetical protein
MNIVPANGEIIRLSMTTSLGVWTIDNGKAAQRIVIVFIQDVTGGRTIGTIPSNVSTASTLTLSTAGSTVDSVTFIWDSTSAKWRETGRALGSGGITTTLNSAYTNSTNGTINLNATQGGFILKDASSPLGTTLLGVQSNGGQIYVDHTAATTTYSHEFVGNITDITTGSYADFVFDTLGARSNTQSAAPRLMSFRVGGTEYVSFQVRSGTTNFIAASTTFNVGSNNSTVAQHQYTSGNVKTFIGANAVLAVSSTGVTNGSDGSYTLGDKTHRWTGIFGSAGFSAGRNAQSGTTYTTVATDYNVLLSNTGARTVTLAAASAYPAGGIVRLWDTAGTGLTANISVARTGSDTINGGTGNVAVVTANSAIATCVSDGSSAWICAINS